MFDLAKVLHVVIEDHDAALTVYRQAIGSGGAHVTALDQNGAVLDSIQLAERPMQW